MAQNEILTGEPTHSFKCVYAIVNQVNGKRFIGVASSARKQYLDNLSRIRRNAYNEKMRLDIEAGHTFKMEILKEFPKNADKQEMKAVAEHYMQKYDSRLSGYNAKTIYRNDTEKVMAYKGKHKARAVQFDIKDDAPINKAILQAAADALGLPLSQFLMQAATKHILDQLGPEWLEDQQNKGKE